MLLTKLPVAVATALLLWCSYATAQQGCVNSVTKESLFAAGSLEGTAQNWNLVYDLTLPASTDMIPQATGPTYTTNNAAQITTFSRIAYLMILDNEWVWVSLPAFTTDATKIGLPVNTVVGGSLTDRITNMDIRSCKPGIPVGDNTMGRLEFFPNCYVTTGDGAFDAFDPLHPTAAPYCYGSFQAFKVGAAQTDPQFTLFGYNGWAKVGAKDLGIGNPATGSGIAVDWTLAANAGSYTVRKVYVFVDSASGTIAPQPTSQNAQPSTTHAQVTTGATSATPTGTKNTGATTVPGTTATTTPVLLTCDAGSNPCMNSGDCSIVENFWFGRLIGNRFDCGCAPGFTGQFCEVNVLDQDSDGVLDTVDRCPATFSDHSTVLAANSWAVENGTFISQNSVVNEAYSLQTTHGCSCQQILQATGVTGTTYWNYRQTGCPAAVLDAWIAKP